MGPDFFRSGHRLVHCFTDQFPVRVGEPARPPVLVHDEAAGKRERQVFDALELSVAFALPELANFEPVMPWQLESVSEKQADSLRSFGIDPASVRNRGHGSLILKHLYARREAGWLRIGSCVT